MIGPYMYDVYYELLQKRPFEESEVLAFLEVCVDELGWAEAIKDKAWTYLASNGEEMFIAFYDINNIKFWPSLDEDDFFSLSCWDDILMAACFDKMETI